MITSDNPDEAHRVCDVALRYVTKTVYPDLETASVAVRGLQAKYGGLWFACHVSYFGEWSPGQNAIAVIA